MGEPVSWNKVDGYDVVIMFQAFCPVGAQYYRQMHPNVIFVPMLDQFGVWQGPLLNLTKFWEPFQGSKILNFSHALHGMVTAFGIHSHRVRFYQPKSLVDCSSRTGLHGFFWIRREDQISWSTIRKLISKTHFDSLHLHLASDPGTNKPNLPSKEDLEKYNITTSEWFENKADLELVLERANVYFTPRMEEGIGQSFLEALAKGQCVVAPDNGTTNEYILHGVNGLLYDAKNPQALDFSNVTQIGRQGRLSAEMGRMIWEKSELNLVNFILTPSETLYTGKYNHIFSSAGRALTFSEKLSFASKKFKVLRRAHFIWRPVKDFLLRVLKR
ncbi:MAG: glycosyltransferase [Nitrosospira sp.]|nr:glycosyltransferase [Nitrosospira sp.]